MAKLIGLFLTYVLINYASAIDWLGNWAYSCDFKSNNLLVVRARLDECVVLCDRISICTHYTWSLNNS